MKTDQGQSQILDCENAGEALPVSVHVQTVHIIETATKIKKCCTVCGGTKRFSEFDKNKSKKDGRDSRCKKCVSAIKARSYKKKKRKVKERTQFCSSIFGQPSEIPSQEFARTIGSAIKEYLDETNK